MSATARQPVEPTIRSMKDFFATQSTEALVKVCKSVAGDTLREIQAEITRRRGRLDAY